VSELAFPTFLLCALSPARLDDSHVPARHALALWPAALRLLHHQGRTQYGGEEDKLHGVQASKEDIRSPFRSSSTA
jgi:hypothetical protein